MKCIKLKPETYKKLIKVKAEMEISQEELISFDKLINELIS